MPIEVIVVPTRLKRVSVQRVPAEWQQYIETDVSLSLTSTINHRPVPDDQE